MFHRAAERHGFRLIALDRPGFGDSPPRPARTLAEWPLQVQEIAGQLGWLRFSVLGVSAGVKYGAGLVLAVPERIEAVALASSFGPIAGIGGASAALEVAAPRVRFAMSIYQASPMAARLAAAFSARVIESGVERMVRFYARIGPETERRGLAQPGAHQMVAEILRSSVKQGIAGIDTEFRLMVEPWGLALGDIRVPVQLWHGEEDIIAPMEMAAQLAAEIPGSRLHRVARAGHVSLLLRHASDIVAGLAAAQELPSAKS